MRNSTNSKQGNETMTSTIEPDDFKAIEMAIELILMRKLSSITAVDIEETLDMEFEGFDTASDNVAAVIKSFKATKGL